MPRGNFEVYRALNKFKVPKKSWSSWTLVGKHVFNKVYESMLLDPDMFMSTSVRGNGGCPLSKEDWKVTAWNTAFTAASITSRGERHILKDLSNKVRGN